MPNAEEYAKKTIAGIQAENARARSDKAQADQNKANHKAYVKEMNKSGYEWDPNVKGYGNHWDGNDGGWVKKKACFIATAVYGDINAPQVHTLRQFRDNVLLRSRFGTKAVQLYYGGTGEKLATLIRNKIPGIIPLIRIFLDYIVKNYRIHASAAAK